MSWIVTICLQNHRITMFYHYLVLQFSQNNIFITDKLVKMLGEII